jgi:COP9 signalosome complex subunit 5
MNEIQVAKKSWELSNNINQEEEDFYEFNEEKQKEEISKQRWKTHPLKPFTKVKINAIALLKMVTHAKSGGTIEVMGMMQGKILNNTMIIMDAFALPVEGTETRVNAAAEGYEYMVDYVQKSKLVGRKENVIGWYHSHPGYGCWLSVIDVETQRLNQKYQEPFLAIVIDPLRTITAGKVELGAFRTFPEGQKEVDTISNSSNIPWSKIKDFGVHHGEYYQLKDVSYFKSSMDEIILDDIWSKYWISTISTFYPARFDPFIVNEMAEKVSHRLSTKDHSCHRMFTETEDETTTVQNEEDQSAAASSASMLRECDFISHNCALTLSSYYSKKLIFNK